MPHPLHNLTRVGRADRVCSERVPEIVEPQVTQLRSAIIGTARSRPLLGDPSRPCVKLPRTRMSASSKSIARSLGRPRDGTTGSGQKSRRPANRSAAPGRVSS